MKFIADAMLGRLAKRLRLLGFDVLYDPSLDDNGIIRRSLEENRLILTRDTALAARPLARNHVLIASDHAAEQVRQVVDGLRLPPVPALTRCSVCNEPLEPLGREAARERVPEYVYARRERFFHCRKCGRIYWKGSHVRRMEDRGVTTR